MYFNDTWTKEEQEIQNSLVNEVNVQLLKLLLRQSSIDYQNIENPDQIILKNANNWLNKAEILKLEWSFSVLF